MTINDFMIIIAFILGMLTVPTLIMAYCLGFKHGVDETIKLNKKL